jgi:hypothetical protein
VAAGSSGKDGSFAGNRKKGDLRRKRQSGPGDAPGV